MNASEAVQIVEAFREAWPDRDLSKGEARQIANLVGPYRTESVLEAIADRLAAELPMPGLLELSRVLKAYEPVAAKADPEPPRPQNPPQRPWASSLDDFPPPTDPDDLAAHMADLRERLAIGTALFDQRPKAPPAPVESDLTIVPPFVREALAKGTQMRAKARKERQERSVA